MLCTHVNELFRHILSSVSLLLSQAAGPIVLENACCFLLLYISETSAIETTFKYVILAIDRWECCIFSIVCGIGEQKRQDSIAIANGRDFDPGIPAVMYLLHINTEAWMRSPTRKDHGAWLHTLYK